MVIWISCQDRIKRGHALECQQPLALPKSRGKSTQMPSNVRYLEIALTERPHRQRRIRPGARSRSGEASAGWLAGAAQSRSERGAVALQPQAHQFHAQPDARQTEFVGDVRLVALVPAHGCPNQLRLNPLQLVF